MITTHFEVYVQDRNRGWAMHARFSGDQREAAVEEAKDMERQGFKVRVTRENYNTEDNSYEDTDIYTGPRPGQNTGGGGAASGAGGATGASGGGGKKGGGVFKAPKRAKAKGQPIDVKQKAKEAGEAARSLLHSKAFMYITVVSVLGLLAGTAVVTVLPRILTWMWHMGIPLNLTASGYDQMVVGAFIGAFLLVAVPLGVSFLPKMTKSNDDQADDNDTLPQQLAAERQARVRESLDGLAKSALMMEDEEDAAAMTPSRPDPVVDEPEVPPPPPSPEPQIDKGPESKEQAEAGSKLRKFVDSAVAAVKTTRTQLDTYNKFAMHLYVAGAVDSLADAKGLVASDRRRLTAEALSAFGTTGAMADGFYDKLRDYSSEERYAKMADMGRSAMKDFLKGAEGSAHGQLTGAIQEWSRGAQTTKAAGLVTLMFTDMVGSTDMTQDRGDEAAQEIVRRHNTIVRMALSQFGGREIKHTGDGIMASFDDATGAIDATISIQRNVANHNKARPDQPLHLRIGLNAGKPIQEENDMFGATVQLAARVCAATESDQTLCTESVRDTSRGRSDVLIPAGTHNLKGFKEPIPLIEVKW